MILWVDSDGLGEQIDRFIVLFGSEGLIALIFQCVCLGTESVSVESYEPSYARQTWSSNLYL